MLFTNVFIENFAYELPQEHVSSNMLEKLLQPVYDRLRLPIGRLEMMSGIKVRRVWGNDMVPSQLSAMAGQRALAQTDLRTDEIECLIHCSVSRDFVEPATSTAVHRLLKLPGHALNFDISNACLGVLTGMLVLANMIQLGQVRTGMVVAGEHSRPLLDATLDRLLQDKSISRKDLKPHFASLTIGSAAAAVILTNKERSRSGHRLLGGAHFSNTKFNHLCQGGSADGGMTANSSPQMATLAEELLLRGIEVAQETWEMTKNELGWNNDTPELICTHQVGRIHQAKLYEALGLDLRKDFSTYEKLGNCGSASLPVTTAMAEEAGRLKPGYKLAMLGIGSGINCEMLGVEW